MKVVSYTGSPVMAQTIADAIRACGRHEIDQHHGESGALPGPEVVNAALVVVDCDRGTAPAAWFRSVKALAPGAFILLVGDGGGDKESSAEVLALADGIVDRSMSGWHCAAVLEEAVRLAGGAPCPDSCGYLTAFTESARAALSGMCGMDITRKQIGAGEFHALPGEISATMRLSGESPGWLALSMPRELAVTIANAMVGMSDDPAFPADIGDAVGELLNVIAGRAKASLVETPRHFTIGVPEVSAGAGMDGLAGGSGLRLLFTAAGHDLHLSLCLDGAGQAPE